jgi:Na+-driven multidrug efflux pump
MTIVPLGYGAQGVVVLTNSAFNAIHKPMAALILNTLRLFIFFVPFCYLGSIWYGLMGLFVGAVLANTVMAALSFMWFRYQIKVLLQTQVSKN